MSPETIRERAARIRLGKKALADACRLSGKTVGMILRGRSRGWHDSVTAIETAVLAEEISLRDYLLTLHPIQQTESV